ncbi:glucosidase 2 subunit beta isoform X1 [Acyrthosiphon pisum]|uniref:Glucosidase 2 subunit beta n=1 Tax=Acyrthosiphon pisum TaxID=7029 RepID=A0A8R2A8R7_ACYPI|nr:glucosidase 2 subunit beta isoform X1 [Acyrthosiphon pisum]|eukprot:XP_003242619.1 PREDICTED: glucosidase 2 subunit beta isoform X1 [Acyrthosiphon pisum]
MEIFYLDIVIIINLLLHSIVLTECSVGNFEIIKGIPIENAKLYAHGKDFSCFDGTLTIPYSYINDDYCDCIDASDEPGTSACPNGTFYCSNKGHFPSVVPSSRVNDGICDCCDGSDEWASNFQKDACQNTCENLSHEARGEANRVHNLYALGFKIREQLIAKGKYLLLQRQNKILHLLTKTKEAQFNRSSMFNDKEIAKEKEKKAIEEEKSNQQNKAIEIFNEIDTNKDNKIEVEEVIAYSTFDQNQDGLVSQDEINYFMENKKEIDLKHFMSNGWNRVNLLIFTKSFDEKQHLAKRNVKKEILNQDFNHSSDNETEKYNIEHVEAVRINKLLYTEKTKIIINESKKAHELFEEADRTVKDLQKQIYELKKSIRKNFGPDDEFAALDGQCYELINDEYIYKLCLFEKITQRPIKGGPEVHLGVWKDWASFTNDKPQYHTMLYDRGQQCLNHYQRFAYVHLSCGLKPKLISVSELNRCEYLMEFELPSVCVIEDNKYLRELEREEL